MVLHIAAKLTDLQQETSYGPDKAEDADHPHTLGSRVLQGMTCTFLWPMMMLTEINSTLIIAGRKRQQRLIDS